MQKDQNQNINTDIIVLTDLQTLFKFFQLFH